MTAPRGEHMRSHFLVVIEFRHTGIHAHCGGHTLPLALWLCRDELREASYQRGGPAGLIVAAVAVAAARFRDDDETAGAYAEYKVTLGPDVACVRRSGGYL